MLRSRQLASFTRRCLSGKKKRKYPIDPDHAKTLPVFDYGVSKSSYNRVYAWGNSQTGALGIPFLKGNKQGEISRFDYFHWPKRLGFAEKFPVTSVACGFGFTAFAVSSDTNVKLYGTGLNTDSQIGQHVIRAGHPLEIVYFPQPIPLPFQKPQKSQIKKISAGRAHLVVLSDEGLFLLGSNAYGQCGRHIVADEDYFHGNYIHHLSQVEDETVVNIECGQDHTFAVTKNGAVYSCGWGADGQTGLGHFKNSSKFRRVRGDIESERIVKVSSRSDFVLALSDKGEVFAWGNSEYGQIVTKNNETQVCNPTHLTNLGKLGKITDIAAGGSFCGVVNEQGQVFIWGHGILGAGPTLEQTSKPVLLPETLFGKNDFQPNSKVVGLTFGVNHAIARNSLGDIYAWGRNRMCCLGLGNDKDQYFPFKVSLGGRVQEVSCGVDHTIVVCKPYI